MAESVLLLVMGDSTGVGARSAFQFRTPGRRLGRHHRLLDTGGRQRRAVPPGPLEAEGGIILGPCDFCGWCWRWCSALRWPARALTPVIITGPGNTSRHPTPIR